MIYLVQGLYWRVTMYDIIEGIVEGRGRGVGDGKSPISSVWL